MRQVNVALGERGYPVIIGHGLLDRAGELLAPFSRNGRVVIVSDDNVWDLLGERVSAIVGAAGVDVVPVTVSPGEESKSWATLSRLIDALLGFGVERKDYLIALGGGVVGDLVGFAASILKRGCGYVQIPTTLLAQVDSAVGGKTAINLPAGKNMVGSFHQPAAVLIDPATLDTLPTRLLRAGYAEAVKYGLIGSPDFFTWCEANAAAVIARDEEALLHAIETSVRTKAEIVEADERETSGTRALLNLGHTFAHALEVETGYSERLLHGEAVALGMALAFRFSASRELCPWDDAARVCAHLAEVGLPTTLGAAGIGADGRTLVAHMAHDKKRTDGRLPFILARGIGHAFVERSVELHEVEAFLDGERAS